MLAALIIVDLMKRNNVDCDARELIPNNNVILLILESTKSNKNYNVFKFTRSYE